MSKIKDMDSYLSKMAAGIEDKLYFLDILRNDKSITTVIDYGCADGTLLFHIKEMYPMLECIGVDENHDMIEKAKNTAKEKELRNIYFLAGDFNQIGKGNNALIILNSVLHEIVSYNNTDYINKFWAWIKNSQFNYICIRDMSIGSTFCKVNEKNNEVMHDKIIAVADKGLMSRYADFFVKQQHFASKKNIIEFLMKCNYIENWDRESRESYSPYYPIDIIKKLESTYEPIYLKHYTLPYLHDSIKKQFDINIDIPTHMKLIFKRIESYAK